jgi:hypothetical protein
MKLTICSPVFVNWKVSNMTQDQMLDKLKVAQSLLSEVYDFACVQGIDDLERLMSCADTCIIDALETDYGLE